ncbi:hypothetical protein [Rhodococcoides fascians]|uniref:hypothetical protein n=1 Tax=Rhodococcoides fascians TaxID=1828 RepID=UPI0012D36398|nr:hypothetical protein [Rhodococcus fascians]
MTTSQKWLSERVASVDSGVYRRHQKTIFEDETPESLGCLAAVAAFAAFASAAATVGSFVKSVDNALLTVVFSMAALFLAYVAFVGVAAGHVWWTERARVKDPSKQVWSAGVVAPHRGVGATSCSIGCRHKRTDQGVDGVVAPLFQTVRGRLDLNEAVLDVLNPASRIDAAMAALPAAAEVDAPRSRSAAKNHVTAASVALDALADRVAALDEYLARLRPIELLLVKKARIELDIETARKIDAVDPNTFDALYRDAGISE